MPLSVCTITGSAYYADGTLGDANIYITADQVTLNGAVIGSAAQDFYAAAVGGVITLILPRGSTARLYGNVRGFHDAIVVAIPDTATADLEDLIPVQYSGSLPQGLGTGSSPTFAGVYAKEIVVVKTIDYAVLASDTGTLFTITGLSPVTFTLPAPSAGLTYTFFNGSLSGVNLRIIVADTGTQDIVGSMGVDGELTLDQIETDAYRRSVTLTAIDATRWAITSVTGDWNP